MSGAYTADGRRRSSMTHAKRGHKCEFCDRTVFGNGGKVSHGRAHVARGEAVEMVKHYPIYPPIVSRIFVAAGDNETIGRLADSGFDRVAGTSEVSR